MNANDLSLLHRFRKRYRVPGLAAARLSPLTGFTETSIGLRSRAGGEPITNDDAWHIGSCGKSITALLYARLVEQQLASWGVPLGELFPDLDSHPGWQNVTIEDLFHCRAGVAANPTRRELLSSYQSTESPQVQRTRMPQRVLARPPHRPGKFVYSNLGYVLAGAAIERLVSMPYENALRHYVAEPLQIASLGFGPPSHVCGHKCRWQLGPLAIGRGEAAPSGDIYSDNPPLLSPAGRMHMTLSDWGKVIAVFVQQGSAPTAPEFVRPETVRLLLEIPAGNQMSMGWASGKEIGGSYAMQGSNTMWSATCLLNPDRTSAVLIAANDGRTRVLRASAHLARALA